MARTTFDAGDQDAESVTEHHPEAPAECDVVGRVRARNEAIADREVERALRRLEARGDLHADQRRAVREMADGIVESLVASPARTVAAAREGDDETLRTVVALFDPGACE